MRGIHLIIPHEFYLPNNAVCSREGRSRGQITFPVDVTSSPSNRISCCSCLSVDDCIFELASESSLREAPFSLVKSSIDSVIR